MERIKLGQVELSRIVYGMWRVGDDQDTSPSHVQAKVEACLAQGITTIDQADIYGGYTAEAIFGAAVRQSPGLRDKLEIVTKCDIVVSAGRHEGARVKHYDTTAKHITASIEASLRDMATDYVDLLLIHRPDPLMDATETGACLDALVSSGKVRAVGVSNFRPWDWELLQSTMTTKLVILPICKRAVWPRWHGPLWVAVVFWLKRPNRCAPEWKRLARIMAPIGLPLPWPGCCATRRAFCP
jgi:predicted oxidoreductase